MDQDPVADEPCEQVDQKDGDGLPSEEEGGRPRGHDPQHHALGDRLEEDRRGGHRLAEFRPPESKSNYLGNFLWILRMTKREEILMERKHLLFGFGDSE